MGTISRTILLVVAIAGVGGAARAQEGPVPAPAQEAAPPAEAATETPPAPASEPVAVPAIDDAMAPLLAPSAGPEPAVGAMPAAAAAEGTPGPADAPAPAEAAPATEAAVVAPVAIPAPPAPPRHALSLQVGVLLPQLLNELDTNFGIKLDYGVRVWKRLSIAIGFLYTQPETHVRAADPRVPGGTYRTDTTQRQFVFSLGPLWRFRDATKGFNGYVMGGVRMYVYQTVTEGAAGGAPFGTNREVSAQAGGVLELGGEYGIGPGAITASIELGGAKLPHTITGDVGNLSILLAAGYRFFF